MTKVSHLSNRELVQAYNALNSTFKPVLVYHLGIDAGFFAEYTYMLNAMLYCLRNKIQFRLYADDANFGYSKGWIDYFEEFCPMEHDALHHRYNRHPVPGWKRLWTTYTKEVNRSGRTKQLFSSLRWKVKWGVIDCIGHVVAHHRYGRSVLFNSDIRTAQQEHYCIPELGIDGDYLSAFNRMIDITWKLRPELLDYVEKCNADLQLPEHFAGCQLRGGDKITEVSLLSTSSVINKVFDSTQLRDVLVLTDDYRLFTEVKEKYPDSRFYTLCSPTAAGYVNKQFTATGGEAKRNQMFSFLATMHLLMQSDCFVGSITTGPSFFLMKHLADRAVPVDYYPGRILEIATARIYDRGCASQKYVTDNAVVESETH